MVKLSAAKDTPHVPAKNTVARSNKTDGNVIFIVSNLADVNLVSPSGCTVLL